MTSRRFKFASLFAVMLLAFLRMATAQDFKKQVIYQIVTDRFFNGDTTNDNPPQSAGLFDSTQANWFAYWGGDLAGIQQKMRVAAAGVGPWDALIREKKSIVNVPLPIILGSDLAGIVESIGPGVQQFKPGDEVYGVTNEDFCGAYCEYAVAQAHMIAPKPKSLSHIEAASVPVVAVTAWQMLFDYAEVKAGQSVLIHGAAGNVGAYAVQLAKQAGVQTFATAGSADLDYVRGLGADTVIDYKTNKFEDLVRPVDAVLDTVGGDTQRRSFHAI
jgi:NADPH:quinone reductase-like Zn-dependent oxidoreductase